MNKLAKVLATVALAGVALAASLLPTQAAFAHAELESSNPEANSVIGAAPEVLSLTFGEKLMVMEGQDQANQVEVTDAENKRVDNGDYQVTGEVLTVSLQPALADGTYKVTYRVVSADGHPIEGVYEFEVSPAAQSGEATPVAIEDPMPTLYAVEDEKSESNGVAVGVGVAVGAVLIGGGMFFLFRRIRSQQK